MAVVYPLALPDIPLHCRAFDFTIPGQQAATEGGTPIGTETGSALWQADYETPVLRGADLRLMTAWLDEAKKVKASVLAWDSRARYPRAYQGGFGALVRAGSGLAFDGTATLESVGDDGFTLGLSGLPAGFKLGSGDPLAFVWDFSRVAYHRAAPIAPVVADSDGTLSITVNPLVKSGASAGVTVQLDKPAFCGHVLRKSIRQSRNDVGHSTFSFSVQQSLARQS